jgi:hypothetical protein
MTNHLYQKDWTIFSGGEEIYTLRRLRTFIRAPERLIRLATTIISWRRWFSQKRRFSLQ